MARFSELDPSTAGGGLRLHIELARLRKQMMASAEISTEDRQDILALLMRKK